MLYIGKGFGGLLYRWPCLTPTLLRNITLLTREKYKKYIGLVDSLKNISFVAFGRATEVIRTLPPST